MRYDILNRESLRTSETTNRRFFEKTVPYRTVRYVTLSYMSRILVSSGYKYRNPIPHTYGTIIQLCIFLVTHLKNNVSIPYTVQYVLYGSSTVLTNRVQIDTQFIVEYGK